MHSYSSSNYFTIKPIRIFIAISTIIFFIHVMLDITLTNDVLNASYYFKLFSELVILLIINILIIYFFINHKTTRWGNIFRMLVQDNLNKVLYDELTKLPSHILLFDRMDYLIHMAQRNNFPFAVILLDLSYLNDLNNTVGHHFGESVLVQVTKRLVAGLRKTDILASIGNYELAIIAPKVNSDTILLIVNKVQALLDEPFKIDEMNLNLTITIGASLFPEHGEEAKALLKNAKVAMTEAKNSMQLYSIYSAKEDLYCSRRLKLFADLSKAISNNELRLHFQPKVDLQTNKTFDAEALLRWHHPELGDISPLELIPLAEQTGLIQPLTQWIFKEAIHQSQKWKTDNINIRIAINLSVCNILDATLPEYLESILQKNQAMASIFTLEITEKTIMNKPDRLIGMLEKLHKMGFLISIDDFGTGYSSISYLKKLPIDEIKIDQSLIFDMLSNEDDAAIVNSIINLAHDLKLKVIAEGVEDRDIYEKLQSMECDIAQGFYISRPLQAGEFIQWIKDHM